MNCPSCKKPSHPGDMRPHKCLPQGGSVCAECRRLHENRHEKHRQVEHVLRAISEQARQREVARILRALAREGERQAEQERQVNRFIRQASRR